VKIFVDVVLKGVLMPSIAAIVAFSLLGWARVAHRRHTYFQDTRRLWQNLSPAAKWGLVNSAEFLSGLDAERHDFPGTITLLEDRRHVEMRSTIADRIFNVYLEELARCGRGSTNAEWSDTHTRIQRWLVAS